MPVQVAGGQRLLQPEHAELGQLAGQPPDRGQVEGGRDVPGHPPPLVQVDHDVQAVPDRLAGGPHRGQPRGDILPGDADLHRPEARGPGRQGGFRPLPRALQLAERRVGRHAPAGPAEQHGHRQPGHLAGDVPQRGLQRPVAPGVEADRLDDGRVPGDLQRVAADEQVTERLEAVHGVTGAVPGHALVGLHPDQGGVEPGARHRVPGRAERRVQRQPHPVQPDRGDLHWARASSGMATRLTRRADTAASPTPRLVGLVTFRRIRHPTRCGATGGKLGCVHPMTGAWPSAVVPGGVLATYILRRLGLALVTLWLLSVIVFFAGQVLPGDPGRVDPRPAGRAERGARARSVTRRQPAAARPVLDLAHRAAARRPGPVLPVPEPRQPRSSAPRW